MTQLQPLRQESRSAALRTGRVAAALSVAVWAGALLVLRHELRTYHFHALRSAAQALPRISIALALLATASGYAILPLYDFLALRYAGHPLPLRRTWLASFIAFALSQNMGFGAITGASVRYRFWSGWGVSGPAIARGVLFTIATFWLGVIALGGVTLVAVPVDGLHRAGGLLLVLVTVAYFAWSVFGSALTFRNWTISPPRPAYAAGQIVVSSLDWLLAAGALYVLLASSGRVPFGVFLEAFLIAQVIGVASHVPGGLGVFESGMLLLLKPYMATDALLPALAVYRAIYYLLPLSAALASLAAREILHRRQQVRSTLRAAGHWVTWGAPHFLSVGTFAAGAVLLVSGATPALHGRVHLINAVLPLALIELSHFAGSIAGMALVLLSLGLRRRLDAAFHLAVIALCVGIAASLLKGLDWEEALFLSIVLAAMLPARAQFRRRTALMSEPLTPGWSVAVLVVLTGTLWLGLFAYRHVNYSVDLWWWFAAHADAPRFLRAMVGVIVLAVVVAVRHLLGPSRPPVQAASADEVERARDVARQTTSTIANLALLGDKALLFGDNDDAFLMYAVHGQSWIALGDPQGSSEAARTELAWRFRELADRHGGRPVFYEVSAALLPMYVELGLTLFKLGEEARVPLDKFSLDGSSRKWMRRVLRDGERAGLTFAIVPRHEVRDILPELRGISDAWLSSKATREKGFSLGRFDDDYIASFPSAVICHAGERVAFANLWSSDTHTEIAIDLMRYAPTAPAGVIDFLFVQLLLWGARERYAWFNLGMAPLSGMDARALAPLWNRIGALVFRHGEHFYNFQGLRRYKDKFDPVWESRYLAAPGVLLLPRVLLDVTSLVSGGVTGLVRK